MAPVTTLTIAPEHPALSGHFPGTPIVPGVLLLDEALCAVQSSRAYPPAGWRIGSAKFVKPVRPGESLTLEHEALPNGSIGFRVLSGGEPVARGVLVPVQEHDEQGG